ncbi:hypothetical protein PVAP13_4KG132605 [Panicum virgatum]|uniref:Uncharacterized protein n=1 Tax=Panicum virgatum TaxID=38727 RepID=A0A8T0TQZ8_PANVG|nr:hypothetical protein PVAP13_4KG132605 [Panicum virgatum]
MSPEQSSSEPNVLASDYIEEGRHSLPAEVSDTVESAEEHNLIRHNNRDMENSGIDNNEEHENGRTDCNQEAPEPNYPRNSMEEHLEKTRTYLLLLAILAISLTSIRFEPTRWLLVKK